MSIDRGRNLYLLLWLFALVPVCQSAARPPSAEKVSGSGKPIREGASRPAPAPATLPAPATPALQSVLAHLERLGGTTGIPRGSTLDDIEAIQLASTRARDDDLRPFGALKNLSWISLRNTQVTSESLKHLLPCRALRTLDLRGTQVDGKALDTIAQFPKMQTLYLTCTKVLESDLSKLGSLKLLTTVDPYDPVIVRAWSFVENVKATEWAASSDGALSLRILVSAKALDPNEPIRLIAELRNNTDKDLHATRPFMRDRKVQAECMTVTGPAGRLKYHTPHGSVFLVPGSSRYPPPQYARVPARGYARGLIELVVKCFGGSDKPGEYGIEYIYDGTAEFLEGFCIPEKMENHWTGKIVAPKVMITKREPTTRAAGTAGKE